MFQSKGTSPVQLSTTTITTTMAKKVVNICTGHGAQMFKLFTAVEMTKKKKLEENRLKQKPTNKKFQLQKANREKKSGLATF